MAHLEEQNLFSRMIQYVSGNQNMHSILVKLESLNYQPVERISIYNQGIDQQQYSTLDKPAFATITTQLSYTTQT